MSKKSTSPTSCDLLQYELKNLRLRRLALEKLIRCMEEYCQAIDKKQLVAMHSPLTASSGTQSLAQ